ncbi:uncharacterized protein LOC144139057 [Haemaphysalis longicornis]
MPEGEASGKDVVSGHAQLMGESLASVKSVLAADNADGVQREPGLPDGDPSAKPEDDDDDSVDEEEVDRQLQEWLTEHRAMLDLFCKPDYLQPGVTNSYSIFAKRTSRRSLLVLPSPQCFLDILCDCCRMTFKLLLLLAGDVESNPGPSKPVPLPPDVLSALKDLQSGQNAMLEQLQSIRTTLANHEKTFGDLKARLENIESDCASITTVKTQIRAVESTTQACVSQISELSARVDDAENRSRRSNLIFYGLKDAKNETWEASEKLVLNLCAEHLNLTIPPRNIERAHRLGSFRQDRPRPDGEQYCRQSFLSWP